MLKSRTHLLGMLFVALSALTIRFYVMVSSGVTHEIGIDSFFYHSEVNVLLTYHRFTWWLNPLSLWGLYPYSDSPGAPTYVAEFAALSGLSVEFSILLYDVMLVFFGTISMYILALKIKKHPIFPFFSSFIFAVAPILVPMTMWSIGEREFLVYTIPFFTLLFLYILNKRYIVSMFVLIGMSGFVISTIHLMFIFLYGIVIALIFLIVWDKISLFKKIKIHISLNRMLKGGIYLGLLIVFFYSLFILNYFLTLPHAFSIDQYTESAFFKGTSPFTILLNIAVSVSGGVGILVPIFLPLGLLYVMFKKRNDKYEKYLLFIFVFSIPIIINRLYSRPVIVFLSSIFIAYGVWFIYDRVPIKKRKVVPIFKALFVVFLLLSSSVFTVWYVNYEHSGGNSAVKYSYFAKPSIYELGIYQKNNLMKIWIVNDWLTGQRMQAYSGVPEQPGMIGSPLIYNPVYFKLVNISVLKIHISKNSYLYSGRWYTSDYYWIQYSDYYSVFRHSWTQRETQETIKKYDIYYCVEFLEIRGEFTGYFSKKIYDSVFLDSLKKNTYVVYQNNEFRVYLV